MEGGCSLLDLNAALCSLWQAIGNLLPQPLRLLENSLRKTNGRLAGCWSSVRADKGDVALFAIDIFTPKAKPCELCCNSNPNLMS